MSAEHAAEAFVDGMKGMMLAALLVGLAGAVEVVLRNALVLDTIINDLSALAQHGSSIVVAQALVGIEIILDVLIPSTSAKAAISMPILWPIAQLTGVQWPDHSAGLSDRQWPHQHGDADVGHAAGVSEHRARAVRDVDALYPAAVAGAAGRCR